MKPTLAFAVAAAAAAPALLSPAPARGQAMKIQISDAQVTRYKIALPRPLGDAALAAEVQAVMAGDLNLVGLFEVLDPRGFLADLEVEQMSLRPDEWLQVGAQGVVKARVTRRGDQVELHLRFFEVARPATPALDKTYRGPVADLRTLVHRWDNDLYRALTGQEGIFLTRIAAVRPGGARGHSIVVMDADGGRERTVVHNGSASLLPAWSPSGAELAFTSLLWLNPDLYLAPSGGGRARRLSRQPGLNSGASFSPDGGKIALTLSRDGNAEVYLVAAGDGRILARLTDHAAIDTSPSFSPDGSKIAFVSSRQGSPQVWVMSADGGAPRRVTWQGSYNQAPRWSPRRDVQQIAFCGQDERGRFDVFVLDLATNQVTRVTQNQGDNWEPTWSPDGRLLAFKSSRGGLWVASADGRHQVQIAKGDLETPAWSPWFR